MRKTSYFHKYLTTPDERVELFKTMDVIESMDDDCEEMYTSGLLELYCNRPAKVENLTLADYAGWYDCTAKQTNEVHNDSGPLERDIDSDQNDDDDDHMNKCTGQKLE